MSLIYLDCLKDPECEYTAVYGTEEEVLSFLGPPGPQTKPRKSIWDVSD